MFHSDGVHNDPATGVVLRVLDPAFGFFVWAIHFLVIYIGQSVACATGFAQGRYTVIVVALVAVTLLAIGSVIAHAIVHARRKDRKKFMHELAIGLDAIAIAAIGWQLFPIVLFPLC